MSLILSTLLIVAGFALLIKGADWLVEGASSFARRLKISDLVIGLTIVSFGTSAPELIVNIFASFKGTSEIAIGNIVGSNISNTLLILGATAAISPLAVKRSTVFKEIPFCLLATMMLLVMANDTIVDGYATAELGRGDGLILMGFFVIFMYYTFGISKEDKHLHHTKAHMPISLAMSLVVGGLIALGFGGEITVRGAIQIAQQLGLSEEMIGLTIVALGTSLPELVTSVLAALKDKADISIGNIIGSNIFNIFWILGLSASINPLEFEPRINADLMIVVLSTLILFAFIHTGKVRHRVLFWWRQREGHTLSRIEGGILFAMYFAYLGFVVAREALS